MSTFNVYRRLPPTESDWTHIEDFKREVQDSELRNRFLECSGLPYSSLSLTDSLHYISGIRDYRSHGLIQTAIVEGGRGYYIYIPGYSKALYDGPQAMKELLDKLHQKWNAIEMLGNMDGESWTPIESGPHFSIESGIWKYKTGVRIK